MAARLEEANRAAHPALRVKVKAPELLRGLEHVFCKAENIGAKQAVGGTVEVVGIADTHAQRAVARAARPECGLGRELAFGVDRVDAIPHQRVLVRWARGVIGHDHELPVFIQTVEGVATVLVCGDVANLVKGVELKQNHRAIGLRHTVF